LKAVGRSLGQGRRADRESRQEHEHEPDTNGRQAVGVTPAVARTLELSLGSLALDRVADRPTDQGSVGRTLDEVVLGPLVQALEDQGLVVGTAEDDDRNAREARYETLHAVAPLGVREREIEQHAVGPVCGEVCSALVETGDVGDREIAGPAPLEPLLHEPGVARVVLHEQDVARRGSE
jgi:hypothetical protein